jgi:sensor c-di-GMP phosphodiesterase-like protein
MLAVTSVDIVKMDIEGSEFAVIEDMLSCPVLPRQICMEFHERFFADGKRKMQKAINRLNQAGYKACSISPNGYEVTFVRS